MIDKTWLIQLAEDLQFLSGGNEKFFKNLANNDKFITILMQSSQIAIRNHQEEKLEALRNAVWKSALNISIEEDMQLMFLNFIDTFTVTHLKILLINFDPKRYIKKTGSEGYHDLDTYIEHILPELEGQRAFYRYVYDDLFRQNLLIEDERGFFKNEKNFPPMLSYLGRTFVSYITR